MRPHHRPLHAHRGISLAACILLCGACVLLLLVGLSLPIIQSIVLLRVFSTATNGPPTTGATQLSFGVWGVCASSPVANAPPPECFGPTLGYDVPPEIYSLIGLSSSLVNGIETTILVFLVIHLIAAGISLPAMIASLFLALHSMAILALVLSIISALLATVVFALDLALVIGARRAIPSLTGFQFGVDFGNGIWIVLIGTICTWVAVVLLSARVCHCCGVRR
jgi:hypothetical protein